jgi:hypothetical protein
MCTTILVEALDIGAREPRLALMEFILEDARPGTELAVADLRVSGHVLTEEGGVEHRVVELPHGLPSSGSGLRRAQVRSSVRSFGPHGGPLRFGPGSWEARASSRMTPELPLHAPPLGQVEDHRAASRELAPGVVDRGRVQEHMEHGPVPADHLELKVPHVAPRLEGRGLRPEDLPAPRVRRSENRFFPTTSPRS